MVSPRRPGLWIATVALALVASISASGYDVDPGASSAQAARHAPKTAGVFVATGPSIAHRAALPTPERRAPRSSGFLLVVPVVPVASALALVALRVRSGKVDAVGHWRRSVCGRRGPPVARLAA